MFIQGVAVIVKRLGKSTTFKIYIYRGQSLCLTHGIMECWNSGMLGFKRKGYSIIEYIRLLCQDYFSQQPTSSSFDLEAFRP